MSIDLRSSIPTAARAVPIVDTQIDVASSRDSSPVALDTQQSTLPKTVREASKSPTETAEHQVEKIAQKAADIMFKGQDVEVHGFLDDNSGRFVYTISDKNSGQVLAQTPPDALLRFFASYQGASSPLVSVDA